MKLKDYIFTLGLRPRPRVYGHEIIELDLPRDGRLQFAQWLHPHNGLYHLRQEQVDVLRRWLSPGDCAIDIGAHGGDTALPLALAVGPTGTVLALEPNPYLFPVLERNAGLNRDRTHIVPLPFAATPDDGDVEFEYSDAGFCNGGRHEGISRWRHGHAFRLTVQGRNLERYLAAEQADLVPRLRYLKVDTEGYDHAVLASLQGLLQRQRPVVRAEVLRHLPPDRRQAFFDFLAGLGYVVHRMASDCDYPGTPLRPADLREDVTFDIFCVPR
jgi:FkbM family methyltransferase